MDMQKQKEIMEMKKRLNSVQSELDIEKEQKRTQNRPSFARQQKIISDLQ